MGTKDLSDAVSAVCAGLDAMAGVDLSPLSDQGVRDQLLALVTASRQVQAQLAAHVAVFDARNLAPTDGCRDVKGFLLGFADQAAHLTTDLLQRGRMLRELPLLQAATMTGGVSEQRLRMVADLVRDVTPAKAAYLDAYLTDAATTATLGELKHACDLARAHLNPDGPEPHPNKEHQKR